MLLNLPYLWVVGPVWVTVTVVVGVLASASASGSAAALLAETSKAVVKAVENFMASVVFVRSSV